MNKKAKIQDIALGLPDLTTYGIIPKTKGETWLFNIQEHRAKRAGLHYDFRLNDPGSTRAYSWAGHNPLPKPGQKIQLKEQPVHRESYMGFSGTIPHNIYGAGKVKSILLTKVHMLESSGDKLLFNLYEGKAVERFALIRTSGKTWILSNYTVTADSKVSKLIPDYKPKYNSMAPNQLHIGDQNEVFAPKIDGAHTTLLLRPGKRIDTYSYRLPKNKKTRIDHSYKTELYKIKSPAELGTTVVRAELYLPGKASEQTTGLLNSNTWKAIDAAKTKTPKLRNMIFDVVTFKGKIVEDESYANKLLYLKEISAMIPELQLPELAVTPQEKLKLLDKVRAKQHPLTEEGLVIYSLKRSKPIKAKFKEDYDVLITGVFQAAPGSKYSNKAIGGFLGIPENGKATIRIGSGLSDALRRAAFLNPNAFIGSWAKVEGQLTYPTSGKVRMPIFKGFRTEKYKSI